MSTSRVISNQKAHKPYRRHVASIATALTVATLSSSGAAQSDPTERGQAILGFRLRVGGRYDNVRKCVASAPGVKGGPAADISFFTELGLGNDAVLDLDLPVMRPILFLTSFDMVQFEPSASLRFRVRTDGKIDPIFGPTIGLSLHHGPDYQSESSGAGRTRSFWAVGPILGGYMGIDFKRDGKSFNAQLGLTPYVIPLFSVDDPERHRGFVVGGLVDGSFRFDAK